MNIIHAIILGIVEGLTEFLPISSTAHLEIASRILHLAQSDFVKTFEISIQFGAILAVIVLYWRVLIRNLEIWKRIIIAFVPTAIVGFVLYKIIKSYFLGNYSLLIWTLGLGGLILIVFEQYHQDRQNPGSTTEELATMPYSKAALIGLAQAIAVVPGISRSAATILAGLSLGLSRQAIVEFSFLLAVPTMAAAAGYDLLKSSSVATGSQVMLLVVGFIAAFASAIIAIKFFLNFIQKRSFTAFGIYRIIIAILILLSL